MFLRAVILKEERAVSSQPVLHSQLHRAYNLNDCCFFFFNLNNPYIVSLYF